MNKKLIIILGVLGSSMSAIFVRLADAPSLVMAFYRMAFSAVILLPIVLVKNRDELRTLGRKTLLLCIVSGIILGLHFTTYFESLRYTSITSSTMLACTEVFFVAFALIWVFKETVSRRAWAGIIIAFIGSAVIAVSDAGSGSDVLKGDLLAITAGLILAGYTIIGRVCRKDAGLSTNAYTFIVYLSASVTVAIVAAAASVPLVGYSANSLLCALGMAVFCTLLGHSIFSWGLKYVQASYISNAKMLSPVFATVMGILLFGEYPDALVVVGSLLVIAGVIVYSNKLQAK